MTFNSIVIERSSPAWPCSHLPRGSIGRRFEMGVAVSSASTPRHDYLIARSFQVAQQTGHCRDHESTVPGGTSMIRSSPPRPKQSEPWPCSPRLLSNGADATGGPGWYDWGRADDDAAPIAAVTAVGSTPRCIFFPAKTEQPLPPSPPRTKSRRGRRTCSAANYWALQRLALPSESR